MYRVYNSNKGQIDLAHDDGRKFTLVSGMNEDVPEWVGEIPYAELLAEAGIITASSSGFQTTLPEVEYELDKDGNPVQALDEAGDPMFDEATGEPIFVPKVTE
jgi:hypothetical protein